MSRRQDGGVTRVGAYAGAEFRHTQVSPPVDDTAWRAFQGTAAFLALALVTREPAGGALARLDQTVMTALRKHTRPEWAEATARIVSGGARPAFVSFLMTAVAVLATRRTGWRAACLPCLVVMSGAAARRVLSRAVRRPRPPADLWLTEPEGFSMPSKHTTLAVLAAGACVRLASTHDMTRHLVPLLAGTAVSASRVYLDVHWPSDIVAGWLFAEGWLRFTGPRNRPCSPYRRAQAGLALFRHWSCA
jgi:undecaprenyl-diphosphatase